MRATFCGENAGKRTRRAWWWNGGSDVIGGAPPIGRNSPVGLIGLTTTAIDEKWVVSYAMALTSS
jgi:hypothetical protein